MKEENYGRVIFAASSNLKRKHHNYIRGSIEKERGQGLKKSTIFTSQGMQTIYKNFAVEKCTQEVEAKYGLKNKARTLTCKKEQNRLKKCRWASLRIAKSTQRVAEWLITLPKVPVCQALREETKSATKRSNRRIAE
ncbi:hypothetical protein AABB24_020352 [Solanum stoloniferum]|uniref:Uncharacterized protein n=1 Tax=Solanum stoloniferum TaxID=62892 RepID=A0ABD2T7Q4_9SOLN